MRPILLTCAVLLLAGTASAEDVPAHTGFVTDLAGLLPAEMRNALDAELRAYRDVTTIEVAVLVVPTIHGRDPSSYAQEVWTSWRIGKKGEDSGVLLLVVPPPEKKAWIATGYGIQPYLTDVAAKHIVEDTMRPLNRQEKRAEAVVAGVHAIMAKLGQTPWAKRVPPPKEEPMDPNLVLFLIVLGIILVLLLVRWLVRNGRGHRGYSSSGYSSSDYGSSSSSSSSDSFGGGDSGGGGGGGGSD